MKSLFFACVLSLYSFTSILANNGVLGVDKPSFASMYPSIKAPFLELRAIQIASLFKTTKYVNLGDQSTETFTPLTFKQLPESIKIFINNNYTQGDFTYLGKVNCATGMWYRIVSEHPKRLVIKNVSQKGELLSEQVIRLGLHQQVPNSIPKTETDLLPSRLLFPNL